MKNVKIYLVGGAVRDELLGKESADLDYVVVGSNPDDMLKEGFSQVGADFPVFLHPETKDEYALARKEKKSGQGYNGFECEWDDVSLKDDLMRRDLTVNAMAKDSDGNIIDYFGGKEDLDNKILRHVSEAFEDDPVRILRIARFLSKMPEFTIADETKELMIKMVDRGDINDLTSERVWKEMSRAMLTTNPSRFFETLKEIDALRIIMPVLNNMIGVPQRADFHAEGDVFIHTMMVLDESVLLTQDTKEKDTLYIRMGALLHDVGKTMTPDKYLYHEDGSMKGSHTHHDAHYVVKPLINEIFDHYKISDHLRNFCIDVACFHQRIHSTKKLKDKSFVNLFNDMKLKQRADEDGDEHYLNNLLLSCKADARGRLVTLETGEIEPAKRTYEQADIMFEKYAVYKKGLAFSSGFFIKAKEAGMKMQEINLNEIKNRCILSVFGDNALDLDKVVEREKFRIAKEKARALLALELEQNTIKNEKKRIKNTRK